MVALFVMIIRKMVQNKWLVSSMFFGVLMTVALVGTIPIYSEAILSRMLVKDLEAAQIDKGVYPGTHWSMMGFYEETVERRAEIIAEMDAFMADEALPGFGIPVTELVYERRTKSLEVIHEGEEDIRKNRYSARIRSYSELEQHIKIVDGRMPSNQPVDGIYEVILTETALNQFKLVLDKVVVVRDDNIAGTIRMKPVGVFSKKADDDPYFRNASLSDLKSVFVMNDELFTEEFIIGGRIPVGASGWYFVLDYSKMELANVHRYLETDEAIKSKVKSRVSIFLAEFTAPAIPTITAYFERAKQLSKLMWSLNVPVLIMLGFYMFMVSNLIVDRQKNEIAILRSRGASRLQVVLSFAIEGLLLCGIAWIAGPYLGKGLTIILGASNGFLEFVQRSALVVRVSREAFVYGGIAAGVAFVMMLIPVVIATRVTIIGHKQQRARIQRMPFWHKSFIDIVALAVSIYGLNVFRKRLEDLQSLGLNSDDLTIDPLQFVMPALFIVGAGLLLLRLYPYVLRFIYWAGRRWWPTSLYATLIQVGRSNSQYQYLMIFLIMTIAIGVFSAGAARTLNTNTEDRIRYANGADFVLQAHWPNDAPPENPMGVGPPQQEEVIAPKVIHYLEPSFDEYGQLAGVDQAAKVFVKEKASFTSEGKSGQVKLIGIDSDEFGKTSWFPEHLLEYDFYDYLNLLAADSRAVLISRTLAEQQEVKQGDTIYVGWEQVNPQPFIVFGIIDYFPTFNPNPPIGSINVAEGNAKRNAPMLIVGNLSRIQFQLALEPYEVWLKMKPGYSTAEFYESLRQPTMAVVKVTHTRDLLIEAKNDPFMLALNGILSLGFLISIMISFAGFLLYWILSLKGRTLQNGMMRAIGLSLRQLIGMLALEQLLTSGVAILVGVLVGNVTSMLFVPNFQIAFNPGSLVPPFKVMFEAIDYVRLYMIVCMMLLIGLGILSYMLSRIRVDQALKLGED